MATARAIAFIALQCFHCSTMQVKQQKRSSNKWTCVVCNEKQSVLKVPATVTALPQSEAEGSGGSVGRKAKRIDWKEYLVTGEVEDGAGGCGAGSEDERETTMIVTELPDGLLKRTKLNNCAYKSGFPKGSSSNSNLYKRQFSGQSNAKSIVPSVQRSNNVRSDTLLQNSMGRRHQSEAEDDAGPRTRAGRESRWSSYMTQEDGEFLSGVCRDTSQSKLMNETGRFGCDLLETATHDQAVEDDVHPDFI